jgi:hypothetical protein
VTGKNDFEDALTSGRAVLVIRCGGKGGKCGKRRAVVLDDRTVRYAPRRCHTIDRWFVERPYIERKFDSARRRKAQARRSGGRFTPPEIVLRPAPGHVRVDRDFFSEREWAAFETSGE